MRYMLFVCRDPSIELGPEQRSTIGSEVEAWVAEADRRGRAHEGHELAPVSAATTIRVRAGETVVADGPFAETKEQIAGFDIIDCANLDEAIELASSHPVARLGAIEVRAFREG